LYQFFTAEEKIQEMIYQHLHSNKPTEIIF